MRLQPRGRSSRRREHLLGSELHFRVMVNTGQPRFLGPKPTGLSVGRSRPGTRPATASSMSSPAAGLPGTGTASPPNLAPHLGVSSRLVLVLDRVTDRRRTPRPARSRRSPRGRVRTGFHKPAACGYDMGATLKRALRLSPIRHSTFSVRHSTFPFFWFPSRSLVRVYPHSRKYCPPSPPSPPSPR